MKNTYKIILMCVTFLARNIDIHAYDLSAYLKPYEYYINADTKKVDALLKTNMFKDNFQMALYSGNWLYLDAFAHNFFQVEFHGKRCKLKEIINYEFDTGTGSTPLHLVLEIAAYHKQKYTSIASELKEKSTQKAFHKKKYKDMMLVLQFLLDNGAQVNALNNDWQTPLHIACIHNNYEAAAMLLDAHVDQRSKDINDKIAFEHLVTKGMKNDDYQKWVMIFRHAQPKPVSYYQAIMATIFGSPVKIVPAG